MRLLVAMFLWWVSYHLLWLCTYVIGTYVSAYVWWKGIDLNV